MKIKLYTQIIYGNLFVPKEVSKKAVIGGLLKATIIDIGGLAKLERVVLCEKRQCPPFKNFWFESIDKNNLEWGVEVKTERTENGYDFKAGLYGKDRENIIGVFLGTEWKVDLQGNLITNSIKSFEVIKGIENCSKRAVQLTTLIISLLNSDKKNVMLEDEPLPKKIFKKRPKSDVYKVLKVKTKGGFVRPPTKNDAESGTLRRHLIRGHFRTYEKKPLFGTLYGTFWFSDHLRGNEVNGTVHKVYKLS